MHQDWQMVCWLVQLSQKCEIEKESFRGKERQLAGREGGRRKCHSEEKEKTITELEQHQEAKHPDPKILLSVRVSVTKRPHVIVCYGARVIVLSRVMLLAHVMVLSRVMVLACVMA